MLKRLVGSILLVVQLDSATARADTSSTAADIRAIPEGADKIVVVRKGSPAPFDGQLFDNPTALRWGNWLLQYKFRLASDVGYEQTLRQLDGKMWEQRLLIADEKYKTVTLDYQKQVAALNESIVKYRTELDNPPWYKSPWFGFTLGVVTTGACIGLGAYALRSATK
jgi:hypothetical protein